MRLHRLLVVAAVAIPALLFAGAAWQNQRDTLREGEQAVLRTALIMREHARKVFDTAELTTRLIDERIDDLPPDQVGAPSMSAYLARLRGTMEQFTSLWVVAADGRILAGSDPAGVGLDIADRGFFAAQREADRGMMIGDPMSGRASGAQVVPVVRRRTTPDGHFAGTVHAAVSTRYFSRFYAEASPPFAHLVLLVRDDGTVLAREPEGALTPLPAGSALQRAVAEGREGMLSVRGPDGQAWHYAIDRVGPYPAAILFGTSREVLLDRWYHNLALYGAGAGIAAAILLWSALLALRSAMAEQRALRELEREAAQREATEQRLRHAQRLDAVGQLTGGVAHDFNNLLTAILGNLELIQRAVHRPDAAARIERLAGVAIRAVQRGSSLTKSLLAFSRRQPLQPVALDANQVLAETGELIRQALGSTIAVRFRLADDLPRCVADATELEAALLNLAINARDAMGSSGTLTIETGARWLGPGALAGNSEARPGRFVMIAVADTGGGMTEEVMAKAFEPFFTTKPIGSGTGLGLSQVFGFVRQLGGHVAIASTPGEGTVVTLYLPAER